MKFKVFICIALVVIILLQATIVGLLAYAGKKAQTGINSAQKTLDQKTVMLNNDTSQINKSLQKADTSLDQINNQLKKSPYSGQLTALP